MVGIICDHGVLQRNCEICEARELLQQYRDIIMRFCYDEDAFDHNNDLLYALRRVDPDFDALFDDEG